MAVVGTYDSDQQKIFFTKPLDITGDVNLSGNLSVGGSSPGGDIVVAAGSEYFQAELTDYQKNINNLLANNNTFTTVDFEGKGSQTGNTTNWNASTNSYTLGSTGLYQISVGALFPNIRFELPSSAGLGGDPDISVEGHEAVAVFVEYSTDNFSSSTVLFSLGKVQGSIQERHGSNLSGTYIFSPSSANTKIRMRAAVDAGWAVSYYFGVLAPKLRRTEGYMHDIDENPNLVRPEDTVLGSSLTGTTFFNVVRLH